MKRPLYFTVVITNYNYSAFLPAAIDSALAQSYQDLEVIVVDDASTDGSEAVIRSYGSRIIPIAKHENEGLAAAFNAGFARARGDIIAFLDADDIMLPETAERVASAFQENPQLTIVHYRLEIIDTHGKPTGATLPPLYRRLPDGDLRDQILRAPDDLMFPPTSGNAFAQWALRQICPIPRSYRKYAENYLLNVVPLFGPVHSLDSIGARYRVHGKNDWYSSTLNLQKIRESMRAKTETHVHIRRVAASLGLSISRDWHGTIPSVLFAAERMASLRLSTEAHPIDGDTRWNVAVQGIGASFRNREFAVLLKVLSATWFVVMYVAPRPLARRLAERLLCPPTRPILTHLLSVVQRRRRRPAPLPPSADLTAARVGDGVRDAPASGRR